MNADMKRADTVVGPEATRNTAVTDASDPTAATPAAQRCRVVVSGGRRPVLWGRYRAWEAAMSVVSALRRRVLDARVEVAVSNHDAAAAMPDPRGVA